MPIAFSTESTRKAPVYQEWIAIVSVWSMVLGFMCSRALMSIGMICLFLNIFWPQTLKHTFKSFLKHPFGICGFIYFIMVFIGGMWSENQDKWMDHMTLFLPLLTFPIGMLTLPVYKDHYKKIFMIGLYALLLGAIGYSVFMFLQNPEMYISGYAHSKQIPTIKYNDHIRFSLLLALAIVPGYSMLVPYFMKMQSLNKMHIFIIISILAIVGYLHLLAAKTGLVCLYLILFLILVDYLLKKKISKWIIIFSPLVIIATLILGYYLVPTFSMKIQYVMYEIDLIRSGAPLDYNYSSAGRLISYKIATEEIFLHPYFGVGTGDVMQHMRIGYQTFYPEIPAQNHLIPHSQYLYNLMAFGLVFFPITVSLFISPFYTDAKKSRPYLYITTLVLLITMTFEAMLQVQLGLFVYLFYTCLWYRWDRGNDFALS